MAAEEAPVRHLHAVECPECLHLRHELMEERIRRQDLERERAVQRAVITRMKNDAADKRRADPLYETALKLWEFWRAECRPAAKKMTDGQLRALLGVLKAKLDGSDEAAYPARYIAEAIRGCALEHYVNAKGKRHVGLELICSKIDDCHERYERLGGAVR
jgi:hypothetical protein